MMHQSAPGGPDLSSPYMLWQYVQFMTPTKSSEYTVHQAFTQPIPPHPPQHLGYAPQQYITNYNYRIQEHHRPVYPSYADALDDQKTSSDIMCKKSTQYMKRAGRFRADRSANISLNQLRSSQSLAASRNSTNFSSPAKGSTFTIDAILNKVDKSRSPMDISPQSEPHSHQIHEQIDSCCTTPFRSEPVSPTSIQPCSPTTARFVQPLMHSTPAHERGGPERRNNRLYELNHPYMFHPYDSTHLPHHAHGGAHTPMTSSLSSLSSLSSGSSSLSMSPESSSTQLKDKTERKSGGKPKRIRTIFTPEQLEKLEAEFERQQYMVGTERYYLAATLNLTEAQVKVWFQNRRIKWRKQHLEQQQARLAQGDLYKDLEEESDDTDHEERTGNEEAGNESKIKSDISDETSYASS